MSLTLHVGGRSAGVDRRLVDRWRRDGGLLIARDDHALRQALLDATADGAVAGGRAGTFAMLFARTRDLAGLGEPERRDGLALRCAITEALDPPGAGHVAALERLILELRAARAEPAEFTERAAMIGSYGLIEAARVYEAVRDVPSPDAPEWEAVDTAASVELGLIHLVGFDDYAPIEWALLRGLAVRNPVHAALAHEPDRPVFAARHGRVAAWLRDADAVEHVEETPASGGIGVLERHLFRAVPPEAGEGVEWLEAAGTDVLHRMVLVRTIAAVKGGTPPSRIAIVAPRLHEHLPGLRSAFAEAGLPVQYRARRPFAASPLAQALVSLFAFALDEDGPQALDRLLAWLRTPYSGADQTQVDDFEAAARRGSPLTRGQLMARSRGEAMTPAIALRGLRAQPLRSQAAYLVRIGHERLTAVSASPPSRTDLIDDAALAVLGGAVAELPDDNRPVGRGEVLPGRLGALLADLGFTETAGPPNGVCLLDLAQARGLRFDQVIVLGLEAGSLPGAPAPDAYLPDDLRARLGLLPPRAPGTTEPLLRFHAACACAERTLTVARRFVDDDGRELAPSSYWNETRRLLADAPPPLRRGVTRLVAEPPSAVTGEDQARALARHHVPATPVLAAALGRRDRRLGLTGVVDRERFSVTQLETYLACGYGWFVGRLLSPQPLEQEWDPAAEGTFGHEVLERAFRELAEQGVGACTVQTLDQYLTTMRRALVVVADELRPADAGRSFEAFVHGLGVRLSLRLREEAERGPLYVPNRFEHWLESETLVPGARLVGMCDRIDVSPDGRHVFVLDYKRSGRRLDLEGQVYLQIPLYALMAAHELGAEPGGGAYLGVMKPVVDVRARSDAPPYRTVKDSWLESPEVWQQRIADALDRAGAVIAAIRRGEIPEPPLKPCPPYCPHKLVWR